MKLKKYFAASVVALSVLAIIPAYFVAGAGSAAINLSPASGSYKVGQTFNLDISVDPGSEKIDTVRTKLSFPADLLEIKNFSASNIFGYQAGSSGFDNSAGTFSWGAGAPGGITKVSNFGTITFTVKKAGDAKIALSQDSLALSAGDNKFNGQLSSSTYSLLAAVASSASTPKPIVKKAQTVAKDNFSQPVVVQPIAENNAVDTQIMTNNPPAKDFAAGLTNQIPFVITFRVLAGLAIILIILLFVFAIYKIAESKKIKTKI